MALSRFSADERVGVGLVWSHIEADDGLRCVHDVVVRRSGGEADPSHDVAHCLRVAAATIRFGDGAFTRRIAIAAALLHDVVNLPKDSPHRAEASALSAGVARELLPRHGFDAPDVELVARAIRDHSYSRGVIPSTALARALQDADRIEALGAIGLMRTVACGTRMGAGFFDVRDPWARRRARDDKRYILDHFFTKLLKLPAGMTTELGRAEAQRRANFLLEFLRQLGDELGEPVPPAQG